MVRNSTKNKDRDWEYISFHLWLLATFVVAEILNVDFEVPPTWKFVLSKIKSCDQMIYLLNSSEQDPWPWLKYILVSE